MPKLEALKHRHPEHKEKSDYWDLLDAVVAGGDRVTDNIKRRLLPNPDGRPNEIIAERVKLATYTNKIGPILNRFNSELFSRPGIPTGSSDKFWSDEFFPSGALLDDDDDARASFNNFLQRAMFNALATGKAIAQVDTRTSNGASNKGYQKRLGELNPYVLLHPRSALWDWDGDNRGFNFVKLHQYRVVRDGWENPPIPEHVFTIFFRDDDRVLTSKYRVRRRQTGAKPPEPRPFIEAIADTDALIYPELENQEMFNVGGTFKFPICTLTLPTSLFMGAQLFESQTSYFRQTAAIDYSLYTGNYSMPIVTGVEDDNDDPLAGKQLGHGYYLTLRQGQDIRWLERGGGTVQTAIAYRSELKRDIYDVLQQIAMSAADGAAIIARSGQSKKEDRRPEEILLLKYGELVREFQKNILDCASIARGEIVNWQVNGFDDFESEGLMEAIADYQGAIGAGIKSPTFTREVQKYFVNACSKTMNIDPDKVKKAIEEIDRLKDDELQPKPPEPETGSPENTPQAI